LKEMLKEVLVDLLINIKQISIIIISAICICLNTSIAFSNDKLNNDDNNKKQIHATSDRLIIDGNAKCAEFTGNVKMIQGETVVEADTLKVFYKGDLKGSEKSAAGEESIEKIMAEGNVKIFFDNRLAEAQNAEYLTATEVLVLWGKNSKITSGKDSISGGKITFYRASGQVRVESGKEKQVHVNFYSNGNGLK